MAERLTLVVRSPNNLRPALEAMLPGVLKRVGLSQVVSVVPQEGPLLLSLPDLDERWEPKAANLDEYALEDWLLNAYWGRRGCC